MSIGTDVDYVHLADVVREELLRAGYIPNSCILAARMCTIVLRELAVSDVEAMACELEGFSPAYVAMRQYAEALGRDLSEAEVDKFANIGAWRICAHDRPVPGAVDNRGRGYNGHVVTLVGRRWLIDPTLGAWNRPQKRLLIEPPFAWEIDYRQALDPGTGRRERNETTVVHRLLPERRDFRRAADWQLPTASDETVRAIINRLTTDWS